MQQSNIFNFFGKKPAAAEKVTASPAKIESPATPSPTPAADQPKNSTEVSPPKPATQVRLGGKEAISPEAQKLLSTLTEESWRSILKNEFSKPYFNRLAKFLISEIDKKVRVYPPLDHVFHIFNLCPFEQVKVVILGQDPYHGAGQAMGMAFSVPLGVSPPPSLRNIFSELQSDLGATKFQVPNHGNLEKWAKQGVFMLNTVLTVEANQAFSHQGKGWEEFTDTVIRSISEKKSGVVFILWGSPAQKKGALVSSKKHHILKAAHPSPLAAHKGFFGCKHFSKTNELLEKQGLKPINWQLDTLVNAAQQKGFNVATPAPAASSSTAAGSLKREAAELDEEAIDEAGEEVLRQEEKKAKPS